MKSLAVRAAVYSNIFGIILGRDRTDHRAILDRLLRLAAARAGIRVLIIGSDITGRAAPGHILGLCPIGVEPAVKGFVEAVGGIGHRSLSFHSDNQRPLPTFRSPDAVNLLMQIKVRAGFGTPPCGRGYSFRSNEGD
ncbi:hypothetical protein ASE00_02240 [Sphingomonas sp. Root710]|nr:hypothetical protein ASE00_02240 [Sphingomonas sp. Root710]